MDNSVQSYIMRCAKAYADNHPEEKLTVTQKVEIPINCDCCAEGIAEIDYKTEIGNVYCGLTEVKFCPSCGKKLK